MKSKHKLYDRQHVCYYCTVVHASFIGYFIGVILISTAVLEGGEMVSPVEFYRTKLFLFSLLLASLRSMDHLYSGQRIIYHLYSGHGNSSMDHLYSGNRRHFSIPGTWCN